MKVTIFIFFALTAHSLALEDSQRSKSDIIAVVTDENNDAKPEILASHLSAEGRKAYKVFKATNEWQVVPDGMAVPEGVHVRMNFATGQNEVKLMEGTDVPDGGKPGPHMAVLSDTEQDAMINSRHKLFSQEELSEALQGIKPEDVVTDEDRERVAKTFRSMEDLKKDFEKLSASFKSDVQILIGLVNELKNNGQLLEKDRLLVVLEDIEYLSHQIDNGMELAKMGAIQLFIGYANGTDSAVTEAALLCIGSTMQSNRFVQDTALKAGILPVVYKILAQSSSPSNSRTQSRALFALSTLVRHFPLAQEQFLTTGGVTFLKRLFAAAMTEAPLNERFAVKMIGLIGDLVTENDEALAPPTTGNEKPSATELARRKEYATVNFRQHVVDADWCANAALLLTSAQHDTREKALRLMVLLAKDCKSTFNLPTIRAALNALLLEYKQLVAAEESKVTEKTDQIENNPADTGEDDYFKRMAEIVAKLLLLFDQYETSPPRVEL